MLRVTKGWLVAMVAGSICWAYWHGAFGGVPECSSIRVPSVATLTSEPDGLARSSCQTAPLHYGCSGTVVKLANKFANDPIDSIGLP